MNRLTMDEYIKRETTVRAVMAAKWMDGSDGAMAMEIVATAPTADVAPVRHGRWIPHDRVFGDDFLVCSKCQFVSEDRSTRRYYHYCPHCGAKMDGGADNACL